MMALNDLCLADMALAEWKEPATRGRKSRQMGAQMYFMRLQIAHMYEGLEVLAAVRRDPTLNSLVNRCDSQTRMLFKKLCEFLRRGSQRKELERLVGQVRNNLAFHYEESGRQIMRVLLEGASRPEGRTSSITRGRTAHLWHFKVADDILDSIVVREIWGIPKNASLRLEADRIAERVQQIVKEFGDFSAELI